MKHQGHPKRWPPKSAKNPTFRVIHGKLTVSYPEKKNNTPNILENDLYLSEYSREFSKPQPKNQQLWIFNRKENIPRRELQSLRKLGSIYNKHYSYLLVKISNKNHTSPKDLTKDESIKDLCANDLELYDNLFITRTLSFSIYLYLYNNNQDYVTNTYHY